ncbi:MAG: GNAT family N-acetyltransferase [Prevotella sp.]|nr:GNAT family N-acetyltransferase [Prevotella sp.]
MNNTLTLRALEPDDLEVLYGIENDSDLWDVGTTNVPYSKSSLRNFILNTTNDIYADKQLRMMICAGEEVVGIVDLMDFDPKNSRAEVGIVIMKPFRRRGYALKALALIAKYASEVIHLHQLYAFVDADNVSSRRLFHQAGYRDESLLKGWLYDGCRYHDALLLQFFL